MSEEKKKDHPQQSQADSGENPKPHLPPKPKSGLSSEAPNSSEAADDAGENPDKKLPPKP